MLSGQITNTTDVEGIHVLNTTSRFNTISDARGQFRISAKEGDTLVVSAIRYLPQQITVGAEMIASAKISITMEEWINELDEVVLGSELTGDIERDLKKIKTVNKIDFYEVGLPGFTGVPEEKIVPVAAAFFPTNVNIEAVYKYISGYYKKLKKQRKWERQNNTVASVIGLYTSEFFVQSYHIPKNRIYDFLLFCIETTSLQKAFLDKNFNEVLSIFSIKAPEYVDRLAVETQNDPKKE
ncbi:MAG: hypothetical protein HKM28_06325 [Flavobacteriaceae bacterium]|nr:hypothetical protein [Flavobacteriaceae bacterium]